MLFAGWFHYRKAAPKLAWFQDVESMLNHHLVGLLGLGSLSWAGHQIHVSLPINQFLDAGVDPKEIPLPHEFIVNRNFLAQLYPRLDPITGGLWLTDIVRHHLAIAILFLIAGHMYRTNWGIGHGLKDILEAHKCSLTIVVAHYMYSMPPYPYLAIDYGTQLLLFTHHMWIGGFLIVGRPQDMFSDIAIQLQLILAQWVQNTHALAPSITAPGATASTSLTWGGGELVAVGGKVALLPIPLGTADFLVHHIHAFTIHVTVLILLKGVLFARSSRLIPDKANLGFHFPCDGPGRGGTCQVSAWDHVFLGLFWMYNSILVVIFHFSWKMQSDVWGTISDQGVVTHITGGNFAQSSITINGWLRDFLWAQASQIIQSYGSSLSAYGLFFLGAHFVWAFSLMFLFSGRGYWQELIESIVWAHNKLQVAPATQPRALSIVQGRAEDLKDIMRLRFPRFSQGLAQDPTTRRIWFGIATAHDFESHDDITEERLYQNIFASHFEPLHIRPIAHAIWDPHFGQPAVEAFTRGGATGPVNIAYSSVYQWWCKGIHITNLTGTVRFLSKASDLVFDATSKGRTFLIVGTKNKTTDSVASAAIRARCHYVNKKWFGGMLTNWSTMETRLQKIRDLRAEQKMGKFNCLPKRDAAVLKRKLFTLQTYLGDIKYMTRLPDIVIIVDQQEEYTALRECVILGIPTICLIDTNCDPNLADILIPSNDDAPISLR
ncbi:hypothetical protein ZIOFF_019953 [Zingiber officinale]|uniref:Small ribosomal subunit protein uS2c n=1 Tax=Zingiber officinale TaxID=94328 RepID=A0A8J5HNZ5_ZINOF|nr:hypothetical protein ZIOFF_019953 [Zingiber officinale]